MFGSRSRIKCKSTSIVAFTFDEKTQWIIDFWLFLGTFGCHSARIHSTRAGVHSNGTAFAVQSWEITGCRIGCVRSHRYVGRCCRPVAQLRRGLSFELRSRLLQKLWWRPNAERFESSNENSSEFNINDFWSPHIDGEQFLEMKKWFYNVFSGDDFCVGVLRNKLSGFRPSNWKVMTKFKWGERG